MTAEKDFKHRSTVQIVMPICITATVVALFVGGYAYLAFQNPTVALRVWNSWILIFDFALFIVGAFVLALIILGIASVTKAIRCLPQKIQPIHEKMQNTQPYIDNVLNSLAEPFIFTQSYFAAIKSAFLRKGSKQ